MAGKRAEAGSGSFYKRQSDGLWIGAVVVGHKPDGTPDKRTVSGKDERMARARFEELQRLVAAGVEFSPRSTVADLLSRFLAHKAVTLLPTSPRGYEGIELSIRAHLIPAIGNLRLAQLTPGVVERMMAAIAREGHARTALVARSTLRAAWNWARRERLVTGDNPASDADPAMVRYRPKERRTLTIAEAKAVMASDHPLRALWTLGLATGMRLSELIHLDWRDVDLERGRVRVRGTKTDAADATVLIAPFAVAALREHRMKQGRVGGHVWVTRTGGPHLRSNLHKYWGRLLDELAIPYVNFHYATRHTCATLLRAEGVPIHIIQSVLRHARITTTEGTYAHADIEEQRIATDALERVLGR